MISFYLFIYYFSWIQCYKLSSNVLDYQGINTYSALFNEVMVLLMYVTSILIFSCSFIYHESCFCFGLKLMALGMNVMNVFESIPSVLIRYLVKLFIHINGIILLWHLYILMTSVNLFLSNVLSFCLSFELYKSLFLSCRLKNWILLSVLDNFPATHWIHNTVFKKNVFFVIVWLVYFCPFC